MRPELNKRFCGRCGEPCGGYEEPAPEIDPPRRCARCAIDVRLPVRLRFWLLSGVLCLGLSLFVGGATFALRARHIIDGWSPLMLADIFVCLPTALILLAGTFHFSAEAVREGKHIKAIRRHDRRPSPTPPAAPSDGAAIDKLPWRIVQSLALAAAVAGGRAIWLLCAPHRSAYMGRLHFGQSGFDAARVEWGTVAAGFVVGIVALIYAHVRTGGRGLGWIERRLRPFPGPPPAEAGAAAGPKS
ncbi:MAG: hypothetical protein HYY93_10685 [Planctomycetes bacterium]|nr:hypothetical protein [Planctomycetota bacterium]